jgi:hypothetical protein
VEVIAVFRLLWRRRLLVLLGAVLAAGAAYVLGASPTPPRGVASRQVLLDTSRSQLAADAPFGADTLAWRATLAAQMLATDDNRRSIAAAAGVPPKSLDVTDFGVVYPTIPASLPRAAVKDAFSSAKPFVLDLHANDTVPIISITATAPDRASAVRLTEAAVTALEAYTSATPNSEVLGLDVKTVTPIDSVAIPGAQSRKRMAAVFVAVFGLWIAGLTLVPALLGALRRTLSDADAHSDQYRTSVQVMNSR